MTTQEILAEAKELVSDEQYGIPYGFLSDSQQLTLIDSIAYKFANLLIQESDKKLKQIDNGTNN